MRHSKYTDYGIRVLIFLNNNRDQLFTVREISEFYSISYHHLTKVMHNLNQLGFVESVQGRSGGFKLSTVAKSLSLGEIIRQLEGDFDLVECFEKQNQNCKVMPFCRVKGHLKTALKAYFKELDKVYIDDFHVQF